MNEHLVFLVHCQEIKKKFSHVIRCWGSPSLNDSTREKKRYLDVCNFPPHTSCPTLRALKRVLVPHGGGGQLPFLQMRRSIRQQGTYRKVRSRSCLWTLVLLSTCGGPRVSRRHPTPRLRTRLCARMATVPVDRGRRGQGRVHLSRDTELQGKYPNRSCHSGRYIRNLFFAA